MEEFGVKICFQSLLKEAGEFYMMKVFILYNFYAILCNTDGIILSTLLWENLIL